MAETDVRVLVPRLRRALEGAGSPEGLPVDAIKDIAADALADITLYTGSVFGKQLVVTHVDDDTGAPDEYATTDALTLAEQSVVAAQGALNYFFHAFSKLKVSERIGDEAQTWEYTLSANLLLEQFKFLQKQRDDALAIIEAADVPLDRYSSFLAVRDAHVAQLVEPFTAEAGGFGGQEDFRFHTIG